MEICRQEYWIRWWLQHAFLLVAVSGWQKQRDTIQTNCDYVRLHVGVRIQWCLRALMPRSPSRQSKSIWEHKTTLTKFACTSTILSEELRRIQTFWRWSAGKNTRGKMPNIQGLRHGVRHACVSSPYHSLCVISKYMDYLVGWRYYIDKILIRWHIIITYLDDLQSSKQCMKLHYNIRVQGIQTTSMFRLRC